MCKPLMLFHPLFRVIDLTIDIDFADSRLPVRIGRHYVDYVLRTSEKFVALGERVNIDGLLSYRAILGFNLLVLGVVCYFDNDFK